MVSRCWYVLQFLDNRWVSGNCLPIFIYGRCCCHFFVADVIATFWCWQMLLPWFVWCCCHFCGWCYWHFWCWQMLLPCLAEVIAMVLFVGGTNCVPIWGWCYCHFCCWQMLLPCLADIVAIVCLLVAPIVLLWLLLCHLWDYCILVADVVARFGWCYCHTCCCVWQMLLPIWLMLLPFVTCFVRQMLFARVADGIANPGGCGSDVMTMGGRWNSHWVHISILVLDYCTEPHPRYEADGTCLCFCWGMDYLPWCKGLLLWF